MLLKIALDCQSISQPIAAHFQTNKPFLYHLKPYLKLSYTSKLKSKNTIEFELDKYYHIVVLKSIICILNWNNLSLCPLSPELKRSFLLNLIMVSRKL